MYVLAIIFPVVVLAAFLWVLWWVFSVDNPGEHLPSDRVLCKGCSTPMYEGYFACTPDKCRARRVSADDRFLTKLAETARIRNTYDDPNALPRDEEMNAWETMRRIERSCERKKCDRELP